MRHLAALLSLLLLSGCIGSALTEPGAHDAPIPSPKPSITIPKLPCPTPAKWSVSELKALGKALEPLKHDPEVSKMTVEWRKLRDESKACIASQR